MSKRTIESAILVLVLFLSSRISVAQNSGADTFKAKCEVCHGADGLANTPVGKAMGARAYNSPDVRKISDAELIVTIKNGKGKMPSFGAQLTDAQIKDVLKYVHTLQK